MISPLHLAPFWEFSRMFLNFYYCMIKAYFKFSLYLFLAPTPKIIYILIQLSTFRFILVYTRVIQVINYYIIIYMMKMHHLNWTPSPNFLMGLLLYCYKICINLKGFIFHGWIGFGNIGHKHKISVNKNNGRFGPTSVGSIFSAQVLS